jgi:Ca-activated chloride channel family protein
MSEPQTTDPATPRAGWKVLRFALAGALGCLVGAMLGELVLLVFLGISALLDSGPQQEICLVIDASGSMDLPSLEGTKLDEVKRAAQSYVDRQDLNRTRLAVTSFGSGARIDAPLGSSADALKSAVAGLYDGGGTALDLGLNIGAGALQVAPGTAAAGGPRRVLLVFTDGQPDNQASALLAAQQFRSQGITIVAIATGDADVTYLAQITGDPKLVFGVASGQFDEGFQEAEKALNASLIGSASGGGAIVGLLETALWTALLAVGVSLALIVAQNLYLKRFPLGAKDAAVSFAGGAAAGLVGGGIGQSFKLALLAPLGSWGEGILGSIVGAVGTLLGWTLLGGLVALGLSLFVPNLKRLRALGGGALGGLVGALAFLLASLVIGAVAGLLSLGFVGPLAGRWLGAAILGAAIGAMLALVEAAFRQAWLEVRFGGKEVIHVNLGDTPVRIGSDNRACTVYARGARELALQYKLENGRVIVTDYATEKAETAEPGDERTVGNVTVTVRAGGAAPAASAASPAAPPPPPKGAPPPRAPVPPGAVPAARAGGAPPASSKPPAASAPPRPAPAAGPALKPPATPPARPAAAPPVRPAGGPPPAASPPPAGPAPAAGAAPRVIRPVPPPKKPGA